MVEQSTPFVVIPRNGLIVCSITCSRVGFVGCAFGFCVLASAGGCAFLTQPFASAQPRFVESGTTHAHAKQIYHAVRRLGHGHVTAHAFNLANMGPSGTVVERQSCESAAANQSLAGINAAQKQAPLASFRAVAFCPPPSPGNGESLACHESPMFLDTKSGIGCGPRKTLGRRHRLAARPLDG